MQMKQIMEEGINYQSYVNQLQAKHQSALTFAVSVNKCTLFGNRCKSSAKSSRAPEETHINIAHYPVRHIYPINHCSMSANLNVRSEIYRFRNKVPKAISHELQTCASQKEIESYLCKHVKQRNTGPRHIAVRTKKITGKEKRRK